MVSSSAVDLARRSGRVMMNHVTLAHKFQTMFQQWALGDAGHLFRKNLFGTGGSEIPVLGRQSGLLISGGRPRISN